MAHAVPTRQVLAGFEPIKPDNRRVCCRRDTPHGQSLGQPLVLLVVVTPGCGSESSVSDWAYRAAAGLLVTLVGLSALTGARTPVVWFKICPSY